MKKLIALLACAMMLIGCVAVPASAKASPEVDDVISNVVVIDNDGDEIDDLWLERQTETPDELKPTSKKERVIASYDIKSIGEIDYPVTVSLDIAGIKKTSKLYVLVRDKDGNVKKVNVTMLSNGRIRFKLDEGCEALSFITDKKTTSVGTSDQTGDFTTAYVLAVMLIAGAGVVFAGRKVKEN